MPSVPVYIRKEDFEKWSQIENKSEFIHQALMKVAVFDAIAAAPNKSPAGLQRMEKAIRQTIKPADIPGVKRASELKRRKELIDLSFPKVVATEKICEHGKGKGQCTQFGCPHFAPLRKNGRV